MYKKVDTGREGERVYLLEIAGNRRFFYWMQDKDSDKDEVGMHACIRHDLNRHRQPNRVVLQLLSVCFSSSSRVQQGRGAWYRQARLCISADSCLVYAAVSRAKSHLVLSQQLNTTTVLQYFCSLFHVPSTRPCQQFTTTD